MNSLEFEQHLSALEELDVDTGRVNKIKIQAAVARLRAVFNAVNNSGRLCANPECLNPAGQGRYYVGGFRGRSKYCSDEIRTENGICAGSGCGALVRAKRHRDKKNENGIGTKVTGTFPGETIIERVRRRVFHPKARA
jgi:hypothetical protein